MQRDEQGRVVLPRETHTLIERYKNVAVACHNNTDAGHLFQFGAHLFGEFENNVLFACATDADRAAIDAAVTGVEHHSEMARRRGDRKRRRAKPVRF